MPTPTLFLTNRRGAEYTEDEESDRTLKILQAMPSAGFPAERYANAYALFNEPY